MKSIATIGLALALGASAYAGEPTTTSTYSAPPSSSPSLWTWFIGGSGGYLLDNEEEFYTLHVGAKIGESGPLTHSLYLEGAYAEFTTFAVLDSEVIPVTLNYKLDYALTDRFSLYGGVGAGAAFIDSSVGPFSDDSVELTAQVFAGVGFDVTSNFQLFTGARWIWVDDSDLAGVPVEIGDDVGLELGARFKF